MVNSTRKSDCESELRLKSDYYFMILFHIRVLWRGRLLLYIYCYSLFMPPFEEERVYCFANVGLSVGLSVGRPHGFR
jgi:hypothetical protein